jgi:hypothetical protein
MMGLEKKRVLDTKRVFDTQKVLKWFSFDGNRAASRNKNRTSIFLFHQSTSTFFKGEIEEEHLGLGIRGFNWIGSKVACFQVRTGGDGTFPTGF